MCLDFKGIDFGGGIKSESLPLMASRTMEEDLTASLESSGISLRGKSSDTGPSVVDGVIPPANRRSSGVAVFLRAFETNAKNNRWTFNDYQSSLAYNNANFITKKTQSDKFKNLSMKNIHISKHCDVLNAD